MKPQTVLNKIMTLLSIQEEVKLAYGQLADGTILESSTFDVGEAIDVVSEDGSKSPAPTGEHEISLKDESGNEVIIRVIVADGKITERMNVELEDDTTTSEEEEEIEVEMAEEVVPVETITEPSEDEKDAKIAELESKITELEALINEFKANKDMQMNEVDVPQLDGAPIEEAKFSIGHQFKSQKPQSTIDRVFANLSK
jgi:hypothetical protein